MDKRTIQNEASTSSTYGLLISIKAKPADYLENSIISHLSTQSSLAAFSDEERGIKPCSLNTQKAAAERIIDGGYQALDELRIICGDLIRTSSAKSNKRVRKGADSDELRARISEMAKETRQLMHDILRVQRSNEILKGLVKSYAEQSGDPSVIARAGRDLEQISKMTTPFYQTERTQADGGANNVVLFK